MPSPNQPATSIPDPDRHNPPPIHQALEQNQLAPNLLPQHAALLAASGINPAVARRRGYRSANSLAELQRLDFARNQCNIPALIIPLFGLDGEPVGHQIRPDQPRVVSGKPAKYETPKGGKHPIDVPQDARFSALDCKAPLFITDSVRSADAAVSQGLCCIALLTYRSWKGHDQFWRRVLQPGRVVYIVFNSDVCSDASMQDEVIKFKAFLESHGATVLVAFLYAEEAGGRVGLDDFLAAGHTPDDVIQVAGRELPFSTSSASMPSSSPASPCCVNHQFGYVWKPDGLFREFLVKDEIVAQRLTNFPAKIVADLIVTDGQDEDREFEIEAVIQGSVERATVPAEAFTGMNWVLPAFGPQALIMPGIDKGDQARAAIQAVSGVVPSIHIYTHTGWALHNGERLFLHAGGAIGADHARRWFGMEDDRPSRKTADQQGLASNGPIGPISKDGQTPLQMRVRLPEAISKFRLPAPPVDLEMVSHDLERCFQILDLAPLKLTLPLFALIWRPPLGLVDYGVLIVGKTGTAKSELAALNQQFYGPEMDRLHLPLNWSSTTNTNEADAFHAKDVPAVADDWLKRGSRADIDRANREFDRLLRAQGNRSGRGRCNRDGSPKSQKPPRGQLIVTAEDLPDGLSLTARLFIQEILEGDMKWELLTKCQADAKNGIYARVMAAYLSWLALQYDVLVALFQARKSELRDELKVAGALRFHKTHPRLIEMHADVLASFEIFLLFAEFTGALDKEEADARYDQLEDIVIKHMQEQTRSHVSDDPVELFLSYLADALLSKQCHISHLSGNAPDDQPLVWGWTERWLSVPSSKATSTPEGEPAAKSDDTEEKAYHTPNGIRVGFTDSSNLYLLPGAALEAAQKLADRCGQFLPFTSR